MEGAFFDPALGFLEFKPGQALEFVLELLGRDQELRVGRAAGSMAQLLRVVGLKDQVAAGFEGGNGAPVHQGPQLGLEVHPDGDDEVDAFGFGLELPQVSADAGQVDPLTLSQLLGFLEADRAEVLGGDAMAFEGQVHSVAAASFREAERVARGELGHRSPQEVIWLGSVGIPALAEALIPEVLIHGRSQDDASIDIQHCNGCRRCNASQELLEEYSQFFRLSEPARLQLLCHLKQGPSDVASLIEATGFSQSHISRQLGQLQRAGLVRCEREGTRTIWQADSGLVDDLWFRTGSNRGFRRNWISSSRGRRSVFCSQCLSVLDFCLIAVIDVSWTPSVEGSMQVTHRSEDKVQITMSREVAMFVDLATQQPSPTFCRSAAVPGAGAALRLGCTEHPFDAAQSVWQSKRHLTMPVLPAAAPPQPPEN